MTDIPLRISRRLIGAATLLTAVLSRELAARTAGANDYPSTLDKMPSRLVHVGGSEAQLPGIKGGD